MTIAKRFVLHANAITLSLRFGTSKNKNIDKRIKETCALMST